MLAGVANSSLQLNRHSTSQIQVMRAAHAESMAASFEEFKNTLVPNQNASKLKEATTSFADQKRP